MGAQARGVSGRFLALTAAWVVLVVTLVLLLTDRPAEVPTPDVTPQTVAPAVPFKGDH